jgi:hypothetical protein
MATAACPSGLAPALPPPSSALLPAAGEAAERLAEDNGIGGDGGAKRHRLDSLVAAATAVGYRDVTCTLLVKVRLGANRKQPGPHMPRCELWRGSGLG